jgi:D-sedoheptulose 7-phosphate isomerase
VAEADDIVIAFGEPGEGPELGAAIATARSRGALTIAFAQLPAEWVLEPAADDPFVRQELVETTYHILWELVHVFFEHRGLLEGRSERRSHDAGASSFLYPFLAEREHDLDAVLADVRESARMKAHEVQQLRVRTLVDGAGTLQSAAAALRSCFDAGGRLLALGNGGSATDATDVVADFIGPPAGQGWPSRAALDLTSDTAIITAIANDIGTEAIFARQIIAHGRAGDALIALSTSGNSLSVLDALSQGRRQGLVTIGLVGYDGGRIASERLADHIVITPSQHIPRIQEAQATAYHLLRELVEVA